MIGDADQLINIKLRLRDEPDNTRARISRCNSCSHHARHETSRHIMAPTRYAEFLVSHTSCHNMSSRHRSLFVHNDAPCINGRIQHGNIQLRAAAARVNVLIQFLQDLTRLTDSRRTQQQLCVLWHVQLESVHAPARAARIGDSSIVAAVVNMLSFSCFVGYANPTRTHIVIETMFVARASTPACVQ